MKANYDFSKGKRGRIVKDEESVPAGKVKISIRLDEDIVDHFMREADVLGGKTRYQTLINDALRKSIGLPQLYDVVRNAIRDEFARHSSL